MSRPFTLRCHLSHPFYTTVIFLTPFTLLSSFSPLLHCCHLSHPFYTTVIFLTPFTRHLSHPFYTTSHLSHPIYTSSFSPLLHYCHLSHPIYTSSFSPLFTLLSSFSPLLHYCHLSHPFTLLSSFSPRWHYCHLSHHFYTTVIFLTPFTLLSTVIFPNLPLHVVVLKLQHHYHHHHHHYQVLTTLCHCFHRKVLYFSFDTTMHPIPIGSHNSKNTTAKKKAKRWALHKTDDGVGINAHHLSSSTAWYRFWPSNRNQHSFNPLGPRLLMQ